MIWPSGAQRPRGRSRLGHGAHRVRVPVRHFDSARSTRPQRRRRRPVATRRPRHCDDPVAGLVRRVPTTTGTIPSIPPSVVQPSTVMNLLALMTAKSFLLDHVDERGRDLAIRSSATRGSLVPNSVSGAGAFDDVEHGPRLDDLDRWCWWSCSCLLSAARWRRRSRREPLVELVRQDSQMPVTDRPACRVSGSGRGGSAPRRGSRRAARLGGPRRSGATRPSGSRLVLLERFAIRAGGWQVERRLGAVTAQPSAPGPRHACPVSEA